MPSSRETWLAQRGIRRQAINIAGWLGLLLTIGVVWVLAMVWANMMPISAAASEAPEASEDDAEVAALKARIAELEGRLAGIVGAK